MRKENSRLRRLYQPTVPYLAQEEGDWLAPKCRRSPTPFSSPTHTFLAPRANPRGLSPKRFDARLARYSVATLLTRHTRYDHFDIPAYFSYLVSLFSQNRSQNDLTLARPHVNSGFLFTPKTRG